MTTGIILVFAILPLIMGMLNLRLFKHPLKAAIPPAISVLIPARNEEKNIAAVVTSVLRNTGVELELIVMDDGSTDNTLAILSKMNDPRLIVERAPPLPEGWSGKQHVCSALGMVARHDLLLFIDADVRLTPDALTRICGFMQRADVGLASGFPLQVAGSWLGFLIMPLIHFLLLGYLPLWMMNRSVSPMFGAGCGQMMVVRRQAYRETGGHAMIRESLHDGITLPRAFRREGIMTGVFDATRIAKCRMYGSARELWSGFLKNATEGMATPIALPIWTYILFVGQVLPFILLRKHIDPAPLIAVICIVAFRVLLAFRLRFNMFSVLFHPFAILIMLALQWHALIRWAFGRSSQWRGRAYP